MPNYAEKVIKIAKAELGYLEKSAAAYKKDPKVLDKKTDGAGKDNYTKYGRDLHRIYPAVMDFPAYWCDSFVDWCFYKAYGISNAKKLLCGNFDDYTVNSAELYKKKNAWYSNPKYGDQIFLKSAAGIICHTGLVSKVTSKRVYTVEGNTSSVAGVTANGGCVREKSYPLGYNRIDGYGRPAYDVKKKSSADNCSGKIVTATVTASTLMVRNENGKKIGFVSKGKTVTVKKKSATKMVIDGTLYTMAKIRDESTVGYCAQKYLRF